MGPASGAGDGRACRTSGRGAEQAAGGGGGGEGLGQEWAVGPGEEAAGPLGWRLPCAPGMGRSSWAPGWQERKRLEFLNHMGEEQTAV